MRNTSRGLLFGILVAFVVISLVYVPELTAQFGIRLPKVPNIGKDSKDSKDTKDAPKASAPPVGPPPEVTNLEPKVVPPGWQGDVVFTGKNFLSNMTATLDCQPGMYGLKTRDFTVENSGKATLKLELTLQNNPENDEQKCVFTLAQTVAAPDISPTKKGSPVIQQVKGLDFVISDSSPLARMYPLCLIADEEISGEKYVELIAEITQKRISGDCKFYVSPTSAKYVQGGKTLMDVQASSIKAIDKFEFFPGAPPVGFKLVMNSGKIYTYDDPVNQMMPKIKAKLKK